MASESQVTIQSTRFVLEIKVSRVDTVRVQAEYGKPGRLERHEHDVAHFTVHEKVLQAALDKGAQLIALVGE